ncbi:hypothetical protein QTI66_32815 [Variovorax sp. J22R133]|uniref:hypothetical protein n=1 Tax=Variovorax brevis TaxID=3053503 RepID=UPI0025762E9E|nr:hypothetical protein [Variovorax sp. J22R133]MDM0116911.1 hypothetical protein [Variovorax sp. J22R133]
MSTSTIGGKLGVAIGKSAAYAAHGALRCAQGTGRFGQDLIEGTTDGYTAKAAELAKHRAKLLAERQQPVAVTVTRRTARA